ncbi:MAG: ADOP family duplicated permease [Bryobacteraceae bacterium]
MRWPWRKAESELDLEVRYHLETLADSFEKQGMTRAAAMRRARREFGGVEKIKDECRDESRWSWLMAIGQDLRFGWRMMRRTPAITAAAVVTLALGIGATTAIMTLADALLWRNLAVAAPDQLTEILWTSKARPDGLMQGSSGSQFLDGGLSVSDFFSRIGYEAIRDRAAGKAQVAAHVNDTAASTSFDGRVAVATVRGVTGNFFPMLQLQPFAGRLLSDADEQAGAAPAVVVTHRYWRRQLGESQDAVGKSLMINNTAYVIAGVLPPGFVGIIPGEGTDLYTTVEFSPEFMSPEGWTWKAKTDPLSWWMQLMARRAPGVTQEQLQSVIDPAFAASWAARPKSAEATPQFRLVEAGRGLGSVRRQFGDPMWALLGLVALGLSIACANIANLLLSRAVEREKEAAMRVSLGCGEGRLMRQFFTESALLAAIGGLMSVGVAAVLGRLMVNLLPIGSDGMALAPGTDVRALFGAGAITLLTAVLFGLYPAWRTARVSAAPALKEGVTLSRARWAPAKILVLVQVALGVLLVTAAIVFTARLNEMVSKETGFERGHVLLFDVRPGEIGYKAERLRRFYFDLEERLGALAGVESVGISRTRPMRGGGYWDDVGIPGEKKQVGSAIHHGNAAFVTALGVPIVAGRAMSVQEAQGGAKVAVISEDMAKELGVASAVGIRVRSGDVDYEVVGVAKKARYSRMEDTRPVAYFPFDYGRQAATVMVRTSIAPMAALGAIRETIRAMDKDLPLVDVFTMERQISRTLQRERMFAWLCGSFGVLALVLCAVGLYGLMSHTTARRTGEIGIRMALGATRGKVMGQVLFEGLLLAFAGLLLGVPLALYGASVATSQNLLPEGAMPYWTLAAALLGLGLSAVIAVLGPALRASSIEPMQALRRG